MNGNWFENIEEYLNGKMSREEQLRFDEEMKKNKELSSTVYLYKTIEAEMGENEKFSDDENLLKKTLEELNKRYFKNENKEELISEDKQIFDILKSTQTDLIVQLKTNAFAFKIWNRNVKTKLAIAAGFIGIVALAALWNLKNLYNSHISITKQTPVSSKKAATFDSFLVNNSIQNNVVKQNNGKYKNDKNIKKVMIAEVTSAALFAAYFKPDAAPADIEGPLENAFYYYKNKKYNKTLAAIDLADLNVVTRGDETDEKLSKFYAHYYKAICCLTVGNIQKAIPELKNAISESPDDSSRVKSCWYLSLAYIKTGQLKKADELLNQIIYRDKTLVYKEKAQKLTGKLKYLK